MHSEFNMRSLTHQPTLHPQGQADRCYAQEWTAEEQRALETGLLKWPADRTPPLERYLRIAATLAAKGVRDVALRVRWMGRFAQQKRRVGCLTSRALKLHAHLGKGRSGFGHRPASARQCSGLPALLRKGAGCMAQAFARA